MKKLKDEGIDEAIDVIVQNYKSIRKAHKMSMADVARGAHTTRSHISLVESGKYRPSLALLIRMCRAVGGTLTVTLDINQFKAKQSLLNGTIERDTFSS